MIEAIIFDHDGVLADTEPLHCQSTIAALAEHGVPLTSEEYFSYWTRDGGDIDTFLASRSLDLPVDTIRAQRRIIYQTLLRRIKPLNGADVIVRVLESEYPLAVGTSSYRPDIALSLRLLGIDDCFRVIICKEDVTEGKPDPEVFIKAAKLLDVSPDECLVVEDAWKGVVAANRAGMACVAIPNYLTADHDFSLATRVIRSISQLTPELVRSL